METKDLALTIITILIPPLGVALKTGFSGQFLLNLILTVFGFYIIGLIHGLFVVLKT